MKKYSTLQYILLILSIALCFIPHFLNLPTELNPDGPAILTQSGAIILFSLVAAVIMWLFIGTDWTSLIVMVSIATVNELGMSGVTQASIGNATSWYLLLCFMLAASLMKTGIAKRIAVWLMTCKLSRRGPWYMIGMLFVAIALISSVLSSTSTVMIFLPILYEIFEALGYKKTDQNKFTTLMMMSLVVVCQIVQSTSPISHVHTILGISTYASYTGNEIEFLQYVGIALPVALLCIVVWFLLCKFLFKLDVSKVKDIDYDKIQNSLGPIKKEEKIAGFIYILVVIFWLLPGVIRYLAPSLYPIISKIQQCYPPMIALVILHLWKVDGKSVLDFKDALKAAPMGTYLFISAMLLLNSCFSNASIGLPAWLATVMGKIFNNVPAMVFFILIFSITVILTQFISNAVTISLAMTIGMPLCLTLFDGLINPMVLSILLTMGINYAFATACATPPCAVAQDSGWLSSSKMLSYGFIAMVMCIIIGLVVGIPLANIICR